MALNSEFNCLELNTQTSELTLKGSGEVIINLRDVIEHISEGNLDEPFLFCYGDSRAYKFGELMQKLKLDIRVSNIRDYADLYDRDRLTLRLGVIKTLARRECLTRKIAGLLEDDSNKECIEQRLWNVVKREIKAGLQGDNEWMITVDDSIGDLPITALSSVGVHISALLRRFNSTDTVGEVLASREFYKGYYTYHRKELEPLFDMDLDGWIEQSLKHYSSYFEVVARKANGESLARIGNSLGVTRERARQIVAKAKRNMGPLFKHYMLKYCTDGVFSLSSEKPKYYTECSYLLFDDNVFDMFGIVVLDDAKLIQIRALSDKILNSLIIYDYEYNQLVSELHKITSLASLDREYIFNHNKEVIESGYRVEVFCNHLKIFYPDGLRLQDDELADFKRSLEEHSGVEVSQDINYFKRLFDRTKIKYCVMGGDNRAYHIDNVVIAPDILLDMHEYISMRSGVYLLYSTVYRAFKDKLNCSYGYFRAALAKYFKQECMFKSNSFYYITKEMSLDIIDYMVNLSIRENRAITLEDIALYRDEDDLNYINARVINTDKLIAIGNASWVATDLLQLDKRELLNDVLGYIVNGEVDCKVLYDNLDMGKYISNVKFDNIYSIKRLLITVFNGVFKNKGCGSNLLVICEPTG